MYQGMLDVGLEQIRAGLAWHATPFAYEQTPEERATYAADEAAVKAAKRGLRQDKNVIPPWDWRLKGGER